MKINTNTYTICRPEIDICNDCKTSFDWDCSDDHQLHGYLKYKIAQFFDVGISYEIRVYWYHCECGAIYNMDGKDEHIINHNNKYLVTHELLNQFSLFLSEHSNANFSSFVTTTNNAYKLRDINSPTLNIAFFIDLWLSFTEIQLFERTLGCFDCFDRSKHTTLEDIDYEHMVSDGVSSALKSRRAPS